MTYIECCMVDKSVNTVEMALYRECLLRREHWV